MSLIVPPAFFVSMLPLFRYFAPLEIDPDEGINVMKAMLLVRGYPLYQEIWSDQPPLFTYLLSVTFHLFGFNISVARCAVLSLSCFLLWGSWHFLNTLKGPAYAFLGCFLIVLLPDYATLSISVMVGLPALTFAIVSLSTLARWHAGRANFWLILSALALSISVLTKAFTGFLAPILVLGLLASEFARKQNVTWRTKAWPAILWSLVFTGTTVTLLVILVTPENLPQFFTTHLAARNTPQLQQFALISLLNQSRYTQAILLLALLGSILMIRQQKWLVLYPLAWSVTAFILLLNHAPVWYHHHFLITIPAAMLAACAIHEIVRWIPTFAHSTTISFKRLFIFILFLLGAVPVVALQASNLLKLCILSSQTLHSASYKAMVAEELEPVTEMNRYKSQIHWVVTDRPLYAFRAGLLVPPNLAVISWKRLVTGSLTEQEILDTIRTIRPGYILLTRFNWPLIQGYLVDHYRLIYSQFDRMLYLRLDLSESSSENSPP